MRFFNVNIFCLQMFTQKVAKIALYLYYKKYNSISFEKSVYNKKILLCKNQMFTIVDIKVAKSRKYIFKAFMIIKKCL